MVIGRRRKKGKLSKGLEKKNLAVSGRRQKYKQEEQTKTNTTKINKPQP